MLRVDGDAECNAWMVLHGMVQHMMYRSNLLWHVQVHGMEHVHGMGRGGWWCCTRVVIGGQSLPRTARSSMKLHSVKCRCIVGHLEEHRGDHGALKIRKGTTGVGLVPHYNACLWRLVRMEHNIHNAQMMGVYGGRCGTMF